jgi:hypothetical protein
MRLDRYAVGPLCGWTVMRSESDWRLPQTLPRPFSDFQQVACTLLLPDLVGPWGSFRYASPEKFGPDGLCEAAPVQKRVSENCYLFSHLQYLRIL